MIELDWGDADETILIWTFYDGWVAQDFYDAIVQSEQLVKNSSHRSHVHIVLDVQHTNDTPNNMLILGQHAIKHASTNRYDGLVIIINPSPLWLELYNILKPIIPHALKLRFAKDADQAYQMMRDEDDDFARD